MIPKRASGTHRIHPWETLQCVRLSQDPGAISFRKVQ